MATVNDEQVQKKLDKDKAEILEKIEKYEADVCGLKQFHKEDAPEYLTMSLADLRRKSPEELAEAYFALTRYATFLQRLLNKEKAWARFGESLKKKCIARYLGDIQEDVGWGGKMSIASEIGACAVINDWLREVYMKIDSLEYMPGEIHKVAQCIRDLKFEKRKFES